MARPSPASLKKVTAENLTRLGSERLAALLLEAAMGRPELKRRLRMELAAEQGAEALLPEIDRRLSIVAASRGRLSWRQKPALMRDLESLRILIVDRLAGLDRTAARDRSLRFLALSAGIGRRVRDKDGGVDAVFARAAVDAVSLHLGPDGRSTDGALAEAIARDPGGWGRWADLAFGPAEAAAARDLLSNLGEGSALAAVRRRLAAVAEDAEAYRDTFTAEALALPMIAADVAARFLHTGRLEDARAVLEAAVKPGLIRRTALGIAPDHAWEGVWIDYLEQSGDPEAAQLARWASFERTLDLERARAYVRRLPDFEDVEAEQRVFEVASRHPDTAKALDLLVGWPALREAAALIEARGDTFSADPVDAERWAVALRARHPGAAARLYRRGAAEAFRRRDQKTARRLVDEAEAITA